MAECADPPTSRADKPAATASPLKEPFVGNVSKVSPHCVATSKDRRKKGHLVFDACFEGGTLVNGC